MPRPLIRVEAFASTDEQVAILVTLGCGKKITATYAKRYVPLSPDVVFHEHGELEVV
jgi:hypothetical protein